MVVFTFSILDKDGRKRFFEKSFLLAEVQPEIVLGMLFLIISNVDVNFQARDLQWRFHTTGNVLPTTRWIELMGKKKFPAAALDPKYKVSIVHIAALSVDPDDEMHLLRKAQIVHLKADKAPTKVSSKYTDFADIFSPKLAAELPENGISNHAIELMDDQQPSYSPIYILGSVKLETLKTYIENNLVNNFIKPSKSPTVASIFSDKKPDGSPRLCVNY